MREQYINEADQAKRGTISSYWPEIDKQLALKLQGLEPIEAQDRRSQSLQTVLNSPEYKNHDYMGLNLVAQANGFQPVNTPMGMFVPHTVSPEVMGNQAPTGSVEFGTNKPLDPNTRYRHMMNMYTGQDMYMPMAVQTALTQTGNGMQVTDKRTGQSIAPVAGAVPPSQNRMVNVGIGPEGYNRFASAHMMQGGVAPLVGGINPSTLQNSATGYKTVTSFDKDGRQTTVLEPVQTQRGKILPGGSTPPSIPGQLTVPASGEYPGFSVPAPPVGGKPQASGRIEIPRYADNQLNAAGQKGVTFIDTVLQQINDLIPRMESIGWNKDDTHGYVPDFIKSMHGGYNSPYRDLYTGLNFEAIRSGAAAMQGISSRAYPMIQRAMEHTPQMTTDLTHLRSADTPASMYSKLKEMKSILENARRVTIEDNNKGGAVPPMQSGSSTPEVINVVRGPDGKLVVK
jgi:hypothetical protein